MLHLLLYQFIGAVSICVSLIIVTYQYYPSSQKSSLFALDAAHSGIGPVQLEQLLMGTALRHLTLLDHQDLVRFADGGKPVGDRDDGPLPGQVIRQPYGTGSCS